jgi:DNA-binding PadR family transcriptional regulator
MPDLDPHVEAELRRGVLQLVALCLLDTPRYGYDLVRLLSQAGFDVEEGTLYPLLRRLEQQGTLVSTWDTQAARPRKYYRLSEEGRSLRDDLAAAWRRVRDATDAALAESPAPSPLNDSTAKTPTAETPTAKTPTESAP